MGTGVRVLTTNVEGVFREIQNARKARNLGAELEVKRPVGNPNLEHLFQLLAINAVEEGHYVGLENPTYLTSMHDPVVKS